MKQNNIELYEQVSSQPVTVSHVYDEEKEKISKLKQICQETINFEKQTSDFLNVNVSRMFNINLLYL